MPFKMKSPTFMKEMTTAAKMNKKYSSPAEMKEAPTKQKASKVMKKNEKNNALIDDYNKAVKDIKTFIADNTTGEVGDSTSFTPASVEAMQQFEKMQKDLAKKAKKAKKAGGTPAKQKASKIMKKNEKQVAKNEKNNAKIDAYNAKVQDIKKFIADNTKGEVGDSTSFQPANVEAMKRLEALQKELKKLGKKIK